MTGGIKIWSNTYISCLQACTKSSVSYKLVRMLASVAMPKLYQSPYLPVTAVAAVVLVAVGNFDSQHKLHNHTY